MIERWFVSLTECLNEVLAKDQSRVKLEKDLNAFVSVEAMDGCSLPWVFPCLEYWIAILFPSFPSLLLKVLALEAVLE